MRHIAMFESLVDGSLGVDVVTFADQFDFQLLARPVQSQKTIDQIVDLACLFI